MITNIILKADMKPSIPDARSAPTAPVATAPPPAPTAPAAPSPVAAHPSGWTCGGKTTCGQMSGCDEAKFYLTQCGLKSLDRDGDGVPCASLCNR